ncbi:Hint domain-containing protein [Roseicyclus mahoneyensis]|uniref:Ca2+-binding RTX toxin-like protein n=1 Tax=Roseicyclus mahoneyensis TaxID=164332 RepID=A0A316GPB6_9RHOB|nr:Hint domain-containing protein [Roseicyclus mahoneyensis]PWK62724.1 Ca2+-binding RTX toxin-like protein [Roseicyclus mahoneyensis]
MTLFFTSKTASISGRMFTDTNGDNSEFNAAGGFEVGIGGQTVQLLDAHGRVVKTTHTDNFGNYSFSNLAKGDYFVKFPTQTNTGTLVQKDAADFTADSDANVTTGITDRIHLAQGQKLREVDAGYADPMTSAILGRVFNDTNGDDTEFTDGGGFEPGIEGVSVQLLDRSGNVVQSTQTDAFGLYSFQGLAAGDYVVKFPTELGKLGLVAKDVGDFTGDSDADVTSGLTDVVHLGFGTVLAEVDAGYRSDVTADFIVEGTSGADLIDAAYTGDPDGDMIDAGDNATGGDEDVVDAGAGDDTVLAGAADDTVFGGSGDDSIDGGAGNDVIFGDQSLGLADGNTASVRESLNWSLVDDPNGPNPIDNGDPIDGFTQNTGSVNVTFKVLHPNGHVLNQFENTAQNIAGIDSGSETINATSSFYSETRGKGNSESYELGFSTPVENVSFRINDIDGDGVVRVQAFDAAGNPIEIELTAGNRITLLDTDAVPGVDTADSNGGYLEDTAPEYSLLVEIPGPVARIVITHSQNGFNNSGVNVTDVFFDVPVVADPEGPGNDTLVGGAGDDLIFGETGNDSILGGTGNDTLYGDDAPVGTPIGPNLIVNGSFEDTTGMTPTFYGFVAVNGVIPGWTDTSGNEIDVHNDSRDGQVATDGNNWLDLEASPGNNRIGQNVAGVQDGLSYRLTFDVSDSQFLTSIDGPDENLVNVYWGGQLIATIDPSNVGESDFETITLDLIGGAGNGSNRLEFEGLGREDAFGAAIDNVSLVQLSQATGPAGNDTIFGDDGDDVIFGQGGDDSLVGGMGNDVLDGGDGNDTLIGGNGDDTVLGGSGDDILRGNEGNDFLDGGEGNDSMGGAEGNDTLLGGAGNDTLNGGSGDDVLDGGTGNNSITGGSGNDWIVALEGNNTINAGIDGTPDRGFPFFGFADSDPNDDRDTVLTGFGDDLISTGDDNDIITSLGGNNTIDAGYDDDSITTGDGDDLIISGEGSDTVFAGGGNDTIYGGLGSSVPDSFNVIDFDLDGNPVDPIRDNGRDFLDGGDGDDLIFGEDDDDTIYGGAGNDTLDGGIDNDLIFGGDGDDLIIGGQGADTMDGGFGNDTFKIGLYTDPLTGDVYAEGAGDVIIGGEDPDGKDVDVLDLSGAGPLKIIFDDAIDPTGTPGESGKVIFYKDAAQTQIAGELIFKEIENVIPCFTPGTLIATPRGEVPVENLRVGDRVITRDNGIQEIRWVGTRTLDRSELAQNPNFKPILIKKGSLGHGLPERDMVVSPQHRLLIANQMTELYFNETEVLVPAKHLLNKWGISQLETLRTTYIHFMFDQHEVVLSNGSWTESFQPGEQTMSDMGEHVRSEIFALFPDLRTKDGIENYAAARRSLKAHEAQLLQL